MNNRQILASIFCVLLLLHDVSLAANISPHHNPRILKMTSKDSYQSAEGTSPYTPAEQGLTSFYSGTDLVNKGHQAANALKAYWADYSTKGLEVANQGLQSVMENPEMIAYVGVLLGGLIFYKEIWGFFKAAARKIGGFISSCVYGVKKGTRAAIAGLAGLLSIEVIRSGYTPLPKNFCAEMAAILNRKMDTKEAKNMLEQLIALNRDRDLRTYVAMVKDTIDPRHLVQIPGEGVVREAVKVQTVGDVSPQEVRQAVENLNKTLKLDKMTERVELVVGISKTLPPPSSSSPSPSPSPSPSLSPPQKMTINRVDVVKADSSGDQGKKVQALVQQASSQLGQKHDGVIRISISPAKPAPPQVGLDKETASMMAAQLTHPAVHWSLLEDFIKMSGRSADEGLMEQIKRMAQSYPIEYQARQLFLFGKYGWTGKYFHLEQTATDGICKQFLEFYRSLVHAYFRRDAKTLKFVIDQQLLLEGTAIDYKNYRQHCASELDNQPPINMRLIDSFLELGHCLSPNCPQFPACRLAKEYFDELVGSRYDLIGKARTPRLAFVSKVRPVKPGDILALLKSTESDMAIFTTALRQLDVSPALLKKYSPGSKALELLASEFRDKSRKPSFPTPCISKTYKSELLEVAPDWKTVYETLENSDKEIFSKAIVYLKFGVHPDDLSRIPTYTKDLADAINLYMASHCQTPSGTQKPASYAA